MTLDQGELVQAVVGTIEASGPLHAGRSQEAPVPAVGPEVERAAHPGAVPVAHHHLGRPVAAGVGEGPESALVPDHHDRYAAEVHCAEVPHIGPPVEATDPDPTVAEHLVAFHEVDRQVGIAGRRQAGGLIGRGETTGQATSQAVGKPEGSDHHAALFGHDGSLRPAPVPP